MEMLAAVTARLASLGYTATEADSAALGYYIEKAETRIKVSTNQPEVPMGLFYVWVDMAAGLFLYDKQQTGGLAGIFDFSAPAKSIKEGDTQVTFALADSASPEDKFSAVIGKMIHPEEDLILAFRRLKW